MPESIHTINAEIIGNEPYGIIRLSQKLNSTIAYRIPRSLLDDFRKIEEADYYGTYILINKVSRQAYVGRSEVLLSRIMQHNSSKEFWTEVFFVTAKNNELSLTDIAYLEHMFYQMAIDAKSYSIVNSAIPSDGNPNEQLNQVLEFTKRCLNVLGYDLFSKSDDLTTYKKTTSKKDGGEKKTGVVEHKIEISDQQRINLANKNWRTKHPCCKDILNKCGIQINEGFTIASFHEEHSLKYFWADANTDYVNHHWTIVLLDMDNSRLDILQLPENTCSIDGGNGATLKTRTKTGGQLVISLKIRKTMIEHQSQFDFKPYLTDSIQFTVK